MHGLGTDIIEINRIADAIKRSRFFKRVFTPSEQKWLMSKGINTAQSAAGLFCAKEAAAKALGTGFGQKLSFQDIEIGHTPNGAPVILKPEGNFLLSISHCNQYATATVLYLDEDKKL